MAIARSRPSEGGKAAPNPWAKWIVLSSVLLLLSLPFLVDLSVVERGCSHGFYRAPKAATGLRLPDKAAVLTINRYGVIRVASGEDLSLPVASEEELRDAITRITSSFPERAFVLKIDKAARYEQVELVLSVLQNAGVEQVFFHTELPRG